MSSGSTSTKRPNEKAPKDEATKEPAITKSKYWIDDGNVIIQVENTQFRVHRSMLSRHSPVFKDMFDIPQPDTPAQGVELDGCPVIHLSDKARDFEQLMSISYDNVRYYDPRDPMSFERLTTILRLGKKYDIGYLLEEGLRRFRSEFPNHISGWDALSFNLPGDEIDDEITSFQGGDLFDFLANIDEDTNDFNVPRHLWRQCLEGRDTILCLIHETLSDWACEPANSPIPDKKCSKVESCTSSRALAIMKITSKNPYVFSKIEIMEKRALPSDINNLICRNCKTSLEAAVEKFRQDLWRDLPSIFKIGKSWEDLKDF